MLGLLQSVLSSDECKTIEKYLSQKGSPILLVGLTPTQRAIVTAAIESFTTRPVAVITADDLSAASFAADASAARGAEYMVLPSRELVFHRVEGLSREWEYKRTDLFNRLLTGNIHSIVGSVEAFLLCTLPPERFLDAVLNIQLDDEIDAANLANRLSAMGYHRTEIVEGMGQFALRGGIFDVFPAGYPKPVRTELFGDTVDSIGWFDPVTQRRSENIRKFSIAPAGEMPAAFADGGRAGLAKKIRSLLKGVPMTEEFRPYRNVIEEDASSVESGIGFSGGDRYLSVACSEFACALDYLPQNTVLIIDDFPRVRDALKRLKTWMNETLSHFMESGIIGGKQKDYYLADSDFWMYCHHHSVCMMSSFAHQATELRPHDILSFLFKELSPFSGNFEQLAEDIKSSQALGKSTVVLAANSSRANHLAALLEESGINCTKDLSFSCIPSPGSVSICAGELSSGLEIPSRNLLILSDGVGKTLPRKRRKVSEKRTDSKKIKYYTDLSPGDLVVHEYHGIGRFTGISNIETDGIRKDYLTIQYQDTDVLYVPITQLNSVSKYLGSNEDSEVRLSRLGGTDWSKKKSKAKSAAKEMAAQLIQLYAERLRSPGYAFSPDNEWQLEFEESFEYEETDDQLLAVNEIKKDMQKPVPMDRLLCGDVGFGKTEVAFRAAMKCMLDSRQVVILVPTTVLARQHYVTAIHRFRGYPVRIATLSRFSSASQTAEVIRKLANGQIDMVIGTHKLFGKNVRFKDLGLLIVDEEQRFGVAHKEKLKELSKGADVLTLTATPIPRTLNMAVSGIRDMSVLEESPRDRYPVETYVLEYDSKVIRDAILREISRGGQVYYLHNRVDSIYSCASVLAKMFPEARIAVGHGKMDEDELSEVMQSVTDGETDILVCTTIIETGIDIPNVNTLIIEDADKLGLAQLHQIRGRVGRSSRHAYAYLTYRENSVISDTAQKRLTAMRDFAEFGAGFRIAMRDLQIRGAGNLLGAEQSGHILSVGYDMYMKLLSEAVLEEKGEKIPEKNECRIELRVSAFIPDSYISSAFERMDFYRRIAMILNEEDLSDMMDELIDRYGDPPEETENLLTIAYLRSMASDIGFNEIVESQSEICFYFRPDILESVFSVLSHPELKGSLFMRPGDRPCLFYKSKRGFRSLIVLKNVLGAIKQKEK